MRNLDKASSQRKETIRKEEEARLPFLRAAAFAGWAAWLGQALYWSSLNSPHRLLAEAYNFLVKEGINLSAFSTDELAFMKARYDTQKQQFHRAEASFSRLISRKFPAALSVQGIQDAGRAFTGSSQSKKGADLLKALGDSLSMSILPESGKRASAAYRVSGSLMARQGRYKEAKAMYTEAFKWAENEDRDRLIWSIMSADLSVSPETLVKNLPATFR